MSVMINDSTLCSVWQMIEAERYRTKDRPFPTDPLRRAGIVLEEAAEVHKEAMAMGRTWRHPPEAIAQFRANMFEEAVQTAAATINLLVAMFEEEFKS